MKKKSNFSEAVIDTQAEVEILARDLKPYHWGILTQYDTEGYPGLAFVDEIVLIRWAETGDYLWLGFESHTTVKVAPDEILKVIPTRSEKNQREKYQDWKLPPPPVQISDSSDLLAARALACRKWEWLPGMQPRRPKTQPDFWHSRVGAERTAQKGMLPDFEDQATAGLLLALVRKVYRDEMMLWSGRVEVHQDHHLLFCVVQPYHDNAGALQYKTISSGRTEVESLVIALEKQGNSENEINLSE